MSIKSSYTSAPTRSYYKGTSFQYSGKWNEGNHYQCDEYVIDFVSLNNVLLKCNKSHTAAEWNKPIFVKDDKGCVIGIEPNEYWQFVIVGVDKVVYTDNNYTDIDKHFLTSIPGYNEESETEADVYSTEDVDIKLANKVDKDGDKQLSDENYTSDEKTKLSQLPNKSTLDEQLANKQDKLISGSNIKSINGESLLGSGNLEVVTDISNKADKVQDATSGNFAGLDSNGNLVDSNKNASSFATAEQGQKADSAYLKPVGGIPATDLSSSVQTSLGKADSALQEHQDISGKVDKVEGKGLSTNDYTTADKEKLAALPTNSDLQTALGGKTDKVYGGTENDFVALDSNGNIKDSGAKASDFATASQGAKADSAVQPSDLAQVATSGSYNDLSDKPTIPSAQIQSDWEQSDNTALDYIKNKPTIPDVSGKADKSYVDTELAKKVDKDGNKQLSTEDYTTAEKTKLGALPTNADLQTALNAKVDAVTGKGLSTNDYTDTDKGKVDLYSSLIGLGIAVTEFSSQVRYFAGQYVTHEDPSDNIVKVYRFTETHRAGPWTGLDVVYTSVFNEFMNIVGADVETLHIFLAKEDGSLSLSGREVTVTLNDGTIMTDETDADGYAEFSVKKGMVYTVSVQQAGNEGYAFVPAQIGKAMSDDKYLYFTYQQIGGGYCAVKVYAYTYGERPADFSDFEGKQVQIELSDDTLQSEPFDANGIATFSFVPQNVTGTIICPKVAGYYTPKNLSILTGFSEQNINANYSSLSTPGIYFTLSDETDVDSSAITAEQLANVIAIHVATEELVDAESDFYVRPSDLWATTTKPNYRWCEPNPNGQYPACPNVPIWYANNPYYNGKVASANMYSDLLAENTYSKNLDFAMAETLVTDNRSVYGFLPTRDQFQVLVDNYESINGMLQMLDGTKSATYRQRAWWMATNNTNTGNAWFWNLVGWFSSTKSSTFASWFPFFAI